MQGRNMEGKGSLKRNEKWGERENGYQKMTAGRRKVHIAAWEEKTDRWLMDGTGNGIRKSEEQRVCRKEN